LQRNQPELTTTVMLPIQQETFVWILSGDLAQLNQTMSVLMVHQPLQKHTELHRTDSGQLRALLLLLV
jgi:hypothetical protein